MALVNLTIAKPEEVTARSATVGVAVRRGLAAVAADRHTEGIGSAIGEMTGQLGEEALWLI
jgi:hypothetical protein